jgi:hypothetical protein
MFDNHLRSGTDGSSRGLLFSIDEAERSCELKQKYQYRGHLGIAEGSMQILGNKNVLIGWGTDPVVTEFDAGGAAIYSAVGLGKASYRAHRSKWAASPASVPDVGVVKTSDGRMRVYASWNGATEVSGWRVLTGDEAATLASAATVPRTGFETSTLVADAAKVRVEALDATGRVLAQSAVVAL